MEFETMEDFNKFMSNLEKPCVIKDDIKINSYRPKRLNPETCNCMESFFPPPWNPDEHPEKTKGWIEFQKEMKKDPEYYKMR